MNSHKAVVWSKAHCPSCIQAKQLLEMQGIAFEERVIGMGWSKEDLLSVVPDARTVPQIFLDNELVGDYYSLRQRLNYVD